MTSKCCLVCLRPSPDGADVFSEFGKSKNMVEILSKHFWFKVIEPNNFSQLVCPECWTKTHTFHEFYLMVEKANRECFRTNLAISGDDHEACVKQSQVHSECMEVNTVEINQVKPFFDYLSNTSSELENRENLSEKTEAEFDPSKEFKREVSENDNENGKSDDSDSSNKTALTTDDLSFPACFDMTCDRCDATFVSLIDAVGHYREVHNFAYGYIKCCGKRFDRAHKIHDHITWHRNPNFHRCEECKKPFKSRKELSAHKDLVHVSEEYKKFQCKKCSKKFSKQHYLNAHTRCINCTGTEEFVCHFCKRILKSKLSLKLHIATIHLKDQNEKFICEICAKVYYSKQSMKIHRETHYNTEEKPPVQCNLCGNMFKSAYTLKMHIGHIHYPNPLECPHCGRMSPNRNALNSHLKAVHAKKAHQCTICDKSFTRPIPLKEHMATHTGEDLYTCSYCPTKFKSSANIAKHLRKNHSDKWTSRRKPKQ